VLCTSVSVMNAFVPPSESELEAIQTLKHKLSTDAPNLGYTFTDTSILRFYRGRNSDEEKAYRALLRHVQWRNENNVDDIAAQKEKFENELEKKKLTIEGPSKTGTASLMIHAGRHNKNERDMDEMRMFIIYTLESLIAKANPEEERVTIVFDLSEFSYTCMDYEALTLLINILQFNYPEILSVALVVNAPFIFHACWYIIKGWLDPVTAAKALFIKKHELSEYFEPESLPEGFVPVE